MRGICPCLSQLLSVHGDTKENLTISEDASHTSGLFILHKTHGHEGVERSSCSGNFREREESVDAIKRDTSWNLKERKIV